MNGPSCALTQTLVRMRMRGTSMSVLGVLLNPIGVGPTLAGVLSVAFAARFGADSVRWAMVCVLASNLPAVGPFVRGARTNGADIERAPA